MHVLFAIATLLFALAAQEKPAELELLLVGDDAPPLHAVTAEEKKPVQLEEEAKRPTVLLFWATWSPPGRDALAQLADLHAELDPQKLRALAISTEPRGRVTAYRQRHAGELGEVTLAVDRDRGTFTSYMLQAVEKDVPQIFLIDAAGRIAWIGHPLDGFETALTQLLAGEWDIDTHRRARLMLLQARKAALEEQRDALIELTHKLAQVGPVYASYGVYHISLIATEAERAEEAWEKGRELIERYPQRPDVAHALAWFILDTDDLPSRDLELALAAAQQASEAAGGDNPRYLHTLARAHFELDQYEQAVETQRRAVELAEAAGPAELLEEFAAALRRYEARRQRVERRRKNDD